VSLRRIDRGVFEVTSDLPGEVSLPGRQIQVSSDGMNWAPKATTATDHPMYLRIVEP